MTTAAEKPKRNAGPRLQHVVARQCISTNGKTGEPVAAPIYDEVVVFGQKVDALEHIYKSDGQWIYAAIGHGQKLTDALNQTGTPTS